MVLKFNEFLNEAVGSTMSYRKIVGSLVRKTRAAFNSLLKHNIVYFKFQKKDGTIRKAKGTLIKAFLPKLVYPGYPRPEYQMVYFDLEKNKWRSFRSFKFIKVIKVEEMDEEKIKAMLAKKKESEDLDKHMRIHGASEEDIRAERDRRVEKEHREEEEREKERKEEERKEKEVYHPKSREDEDDKVYKAGDKIPEDVLKRRSVDLRHGSRKNKFTHEANDDFKKHKDDKEHIEETEDEHKKVYKEGDKIPEEELSRRSSDFRHGSRKNKFTHESNDKFKKDKEE